MSGMDNFLKMLESAARKESEEFGKWRRISYATEFEALSHARELTLLGIGRIVRFEYDGRTVYGVFYGTSVKGAFEVLWFNKECGELVKATLSPNSVLEILSIEELEKRLA